MIEVSVAGGDPVVGRNSPLTIRFANVGRGPCQNVVFKLRLPPGLVLMSGSDRVEISVIPTGRTHEHAVTVRATRPGRFALTSTNFSYRDEFDLPVRVTDFHAELLVTSAVELPRIPQPVGRPTVECDDGDLELGSWEFLRIVVRNGTGVVLHNVTVEVSGPFDSDGKRSRIERLADGRGGRFRFHVRAVEGGRHVPVTVRTTYDHPDAAGAIRTVAQVDHVYVVVRADRAETPAVQTILYLAASPRNMSPLRSDEEMREVKARLQLSRYRDRYRIEWQPAARFDDISQALIDHDPHLVHFAGHGNRNGDLCVENAYGNIDPIAPEGLAELFGQHKSTIRCVVLNACFTVRLAEALAARIDHVIGMRTRIADEAAIQFSTGFYIGLFGGMSVPDAYTRGHASIRARSEDGAQALTPLLFPPIGG